MTPVRLDAARLRLKRSAEICFHQAMATYVYETIPKKAGQKPRQFEYEQSMKDAPLTKCPKTGDPVRRIITGGTIITRGTSILSMNRPKKSG